MDLPATLRSNEKKAPSNMTWDDGKKDLVNALTACHVFDVSCLAKSQQFSITFLSIHMCLAGVSKTLVEHGICGVFLAC